MVRIPQITSLETAIRLYYERIELGNRDVLELFGKLGTDRVVKLKKAAKAEMLERGVMSWNASKVNTKVAYETWGLNIDDLERRYNKLKKLLGKG